MSLLKNVVTHSGAKIRVEIGDTDRIGHFYLNLHANDQILCCNLYCSLFYTINTILNAHETPFENFQTLHITMGYNSNAIL